jgi:hypothetical protein
MPLSHLEGIYESEIMRILKEILRDYADFAVLSTSPSLHKVLDFLFNT